MGCSKEAEGDGSMVEPDAADFTAAGDDRPRRSAARPCVRPRRRRPRDHRLIGRPVRGDTSELVISSGRTGYVALYRLRNGIASVEILTIRLQREAGYRE
jgi:plasmid stabilization system protein ParE